MNSDGQKRYEKFIALVREAYPQLTKEKQFKKGQELWNQVKNDQTTYDKTVLNLKATSGKEKNKNAKMWANFISPPKKKKTVQIDAIETGEGQPDKSTQPPPAESNGIIDDEQSTSGKNEREKPAQEKCSKEINNLKGQLGSLTTLKNSGMSLVTNKQINDVKKRLHEKEMLLKKLQREKERQSKRRHEMRKKIEEVCSSSEAAASELRNFNRKSTGRPRKEVDQPELLSAIVQIVEASCAADDRRRCEHLRSIKTLDDLQNELVNLGFNLSRSATYLRLLPRRSDSGEGKRHVQTVNVKLVRPENSLRKKNSDRMFAKSFMDDLFDVCELFGPKSVLVLSIDDKARVKLGLAAASLQSPILMSMDYKVRLPDHSFAVGERHSLIPSVYGVCNINEKGRLTYSGDTFIRIRSGKHDSSTPYTHAYDIRELFHCHLVEVKPILIFMSDGASDEAPRYPKPLQTGISLFKELKLDVFLHGVNAAGLSAFNPVERRMAPLSHDLAGMILPHDSYGNHLDVSGKTADLELEKKNFFKAAEILSNIWSETVIDGHPVDSQAIPLDQTFIPPATDAKWISEHVQQTRYTLQIAKCQNETCCEPFVTDWLVAFPDRFVPFPAIYSYGPNGPVAVEPSEYIKNPKSFDFVKLNNRLLLKKTPIAGGVYTKVPFDLYCPSMQGKLSKGICPVCESYWPSAAAMLRHKKCHRKIRQLIQNEGSESELESEDERNEIALSEFISGNESESNKHETDNIIPKFNNIFDILASPFMEVQ